MKIVLDESVSYGLGEVLRHEGHDVIAIAEAATAGNTDEEVFKSKHPSGEYSGRLATLYRESVKIR